TRARLGEPANPQEELDRAVQAYARQLARHGDEVLVIDQLTTPETVVPACVDVEVERERLPQPAWWDRPHGALDDTELHTLLDMLEKTITRHDEHQAAENARAQRHADRLTAAETGQGPAVTHLHNQRGLLREAARLQQLATQSDTAATVVQARITAQAAAEQDLNRRAAKNPVVLALQGTTRAKLGAQAALVRETIRADITERDTHSGQTRAYRAQANAHLRTAGISTGNAQNALPAYETSWPDRLAAARTIDITDARIPQGQTSRQRNAADLAREGFPGHYVSPTLAAEADAARTHLGPLRAELAHRHNLSPVHAATETSDRADARTVARAQVRQVMAERADAGRRQPQPQRPTQPRPDPTATREPGTPDHNTSGAPTAGPVDRRATCATEIEIQAAVREHRAAETARRQREAAHRAASEPSRYHPTHDRHPDRGWGYSR
nr:hypothetical protein [Longispora sp. (in: high G+C Gram-positive bacteria)]